MRSLGLRSPPVVNYNVSLDRTVVVEPAQKFLRPKVVGFGRFDRVAIDDVRFVLLGQLLQFWYKFQVRKVLAFEIVFFVRQEQWVRLFLEVIGNSETQPFAFRRPLHFPQYVSFRS